MKRTLIVLALSSFLIAAIPPHEVQNVRLEVERYALGLQVDVLSAKRNPERFRALNRALDEIKMLRENSFTATQADEGYLDLMVNALEAIPPESQFKRKDCAKYENDFLNQFEPLAEEAPMEPAVKPGWAVLQALCR
ncbi:hypothetical protein [Bdellovibrio sp. HCB2-146]|uniref:hypothetical protein n=1 Tax=Bdellovibrio sp. HCB2-146 TaxID=3394362 RepID=UPI0039BCFA4B